MEGEHLHRKHYFLALAMVFVALAFALVFVLCVAIERHLSATAASAGVAAGIIASWTPIAVGVFLPIAAALFLMRKPSRPPRPNHPRIEHLRIAGKYAPTGSAKMGVSPLDLR